jgi:hypothetical protein
MMTEVFISVVSSSEPEFPVHDDTPIIASTAVAKIKQAKILFIAAQR